LPITPAAEPPAVVQTVTVTAARLPPPTGDAAFSIITLTPADLEGQPRLDEAIKQVPGASLFRRTSSAAANPTTQGLSLRSIAPSGAGRALVTLDGVPQNDPFGGWVIWSSLPTEAIEGVSVVRGAGAGPYGAGALTGVVALDELSRPEAVEAQASLAELGGRRAAAAATHVIGKAELFASGSVEHNDGWVPVREGRGAADDRLSLDDWSLATRLQAPLGRAVMAVRVGAYREHRHAGIVGAQSTAQGSDASVTIAAQPDADHTGWRLQGWVRQSNLANSSAAVGPGRAFTTPANDQYATPAIGWGLNAALRGASRAFTWETGADVRGAAGEDQENFRNLGAGFTRNRIAGGRTLVAGAYGEATLKTGAWLLTGGARLDGWATAGGHRIETDRATGAVTFQDHPADRSGTVFSGRVGARRDLTDGLYVRAAAYSGFRAPTLNELYRPFRVGNDITEANADLKPERLYGVEGGFGGTEGRLTWEAVGFYNQLKDAVTNVTIGAGPGTFPDFPGAGFVPAGGALRQRQNAGAIDAYGVEAQAAYALSHAVRVRASGGYTHARVDGGAQAPQLTGLRPAQTPRFTGTVGVDVTPLQRLQLHGDLRYESARFDDDQNTRRLAPATRVDVRADLEIGHGAGVFAAVDNVFDARIQTARTGNDIVSYDMPRVFSIGLTFRR
jgi:outer membrane receptor protein involved in Fe transport